MLTLAGCTDTLDVFDTTLGIADAHAGDMETLDGCKNSETVKDAVANKIRHFCTGAADNPRWTIHCFGDVAMLNCVFRCVDAITTDRAAEPQLAGRLLAGDDPCKNVQLVTCDVVHELRIFLKGAVRNHEMATAIHHELSGKPEAFGKRLENSVKARRRLSEVQGEVIRELGSLGGNCKTRMEKFGFAPQRFGSEATPWEGVIISYLAILRDLSIDVDSARYTAQEHKRDNATQECISDPTHALFMAMNADLQMIGLQAIDEMQSDFQDIGYLPGRMRSLRNVLVKLVVDGRVLSVENEAEHLFNRAMLDQMKLGHVFFHGDSVSILHWHAIGRKPQWAKAASAATEQVATLIIDFIDTTYGNTGTIDLLFEAFDLKQWSGRGTQPSRRVAMLNMYQRLVVSCGWPDSTVEFIAVRDLTIECWRKGTSAQKSPAEKAKFMQSCWRKACLLKELQGCNVKGIQRVLAWYSSCRRTTCNTERDIGVLSRLSSRTKAEICIQYDRDVLTIVRHGPSKIEKLHRRRLLIWTTMKNMFVKDTVHSQAVE